MQISESVCLHCHEREHCFDRIKVVLSNACPSPRSLYLCDVTLFCIWQQGSFFFIYLFYLFICAVSLPDSLNRITAKGEGLISMKLGLSMCMDLIVCAVKGTPIFKLQP